MELARQLAPSGFPSLCRKPCKTVFLGQSVLRFDAGLSQPPVTALAVPIEHPASLATVSNPNLQIKHSQFSMYLEV